MITSRLAPGAAFLRPMRRSFRNIAILGVMTVTLASCMDVPGGTSAKTGFKKQYLLARTQLEKGQVQKALSSYRQLAQERGPFESRILLELGHAYLRVADFDAARRTVGALTGAEDTHLRAAALAVQGTAEQELGHRRLSSGDKGKATKSHFKAAETAFKAMLKLHPDMDQTGAMGTRLSQVQAALKGL